MYYGGMDAWWGIVCMVAIVAVVALIAWAVVVSTNRREIKPDRGGASDAVSVLDSRFASGEIDESEYQRRRQLLTQH
jgi:putative membrane protein